MTHELYTQLTDYLRSSTDYSLGVRIYFDCTHSAAIRDSLLKFPSRDKLRNYLIFQLNKYKDIVLTESVKTNSVKTNFVQNLEIAPLPTELRDPKPVYKELAYYHALLSTESDSDILFSYAKKCVDLDSQLADIKYEHDFYNQYGKLPERTALPKAENCNETLAQLVLQFKKMPQLIYADKQLIKDIEAKIEASNDITTIAKHNKRLSEVQDRLQAKEIERKRLETEIQSKSKN